MKNLIEALTILLKYGDTPYPTNCSHDMLSLYPAVQLELISPEDIARLGELSFHIDTDTNDGFYSFHYGSC